ncbi:Peptidase inhibitor family I36 [Amycolatopsis lurida]|uniref:peptidase inhibitor family I36 protein n=1 Tax=Amycolatopsis lurida TaxID=31959 RepID=UPI00089D4F7F|nr:peptidase inhibitor family I36 protein [Amycolatopsis lurida]SEC86278.1 Peptidase inhibitor family I36 [Amycolatopsis lurida]
MKAKAFFRAATVALGIGAAVLASAPVATARPSDVLARYAADGIDVGRLPAGYSVVGDQILWQRQTEDGVLSTGLGTFCSLGFLCLYRATGTTGTLWFTNDRQRMHNLGNYSFNDATRSWWNNSSYDAIWYFHTSGSPNPYVCMNAGDRVRNPPASQQRQASLAYVYPNSTTC